MSDTLAGVGQENTDQVIKSKYCRELGIHTDRKCEDCSGDTPALDVSFSVETSLDFEAREEKVCEGTFGAFTPGLKGQEQLNCVLIPRPSDFRVALKYEQTDTLE